MYLYALYELLKEKGVSFDEFGTDEEIHVESMLARVLFSTIVSPECTSNARGRSNDVEQQNLTRKNIAQPCSDRKPIIFAQNMTVSHRLDPRGEPSITGSDSVYVHYSVPLRETVSALAQRASMFK